MRQLSIPAAACAGQLLTGLAGAAVPPGQPGYYSVLHYVVSNSVTATGQCTDAVGSYYTSSYYYPGPAKPGAIEWRPLNVASYLGESIAKYPVTPAAGVSHSSGSYKITIEPAGTVVSATFTSDNTAFDAHSSISRVTYTYPTSAGGTCTSNEQDNYTPVGK